MTEASVDGILTAVSELKSDSRLVILLGTPEGLKAVSKKFSSLQGVIRIKRGVFIAQEYSEIHEAVLLNQPFVSFSKTKEIPTVREKMKDAYSNSVYSLVSFSFISPTAQQKKRVERLVRKTTGIRLRPGVILFPLLRSKERRRIVGTEDEKLLIDSSEFSKILSSIGSNTFRWSRLKIDNLDGSKHISDAVEQTLNRDLASIQVRIHKLRKQLNGSNVTIGQLKKNYSVLSRSFREIKTKWMIARTIWFFDAEKALKRTYNMLISTRRAISSLETKQSSSSPDTNI
ncbi:MAG: hypothetical protein ACFFDM_12225 [Candidatus Thorarchaeota archaeon]